MVLFWSPWRRVDDKQPAETVFVLATLERESYETDLLGHINLYIALDPKGVVETNVCSIA